MSMTSEFRQDIVTKDWVVVAENRALRPQQFRGERIRRSDPGEDRCPFRELSESVLFEAAHPSGGAGRSDWLVRVVPNKYPVFAEGICPEPEPSGPYTTLAGAGFHEVVVTRDHRRAIAEMTDAEVHSVIGAFRARSLALRSRKRECIRYVAIFHNHGELAGASIAHPHSQIIAIPVVPSDVRRSLRASARYMKKEGACAHCVVVQHEMQERRRVVFENDSFVVVAPFASRVAFELRLYPKAHRAHFSELSEEDQQLMAQALRVTLAKFHRGLDDPDYNFFIHTAPVGGRNRYAYYHWHMEILPKTTIAAGFEIATGVEIVTVSPEAAATLLNAVKT